ncbi:hypothetical protein ACTXJ5_08115 [Psychrobacter alimentarius]|uniref:hypothetical protein n=1 Tax=Psychrobacter alimentarius TaxID=261164 RepID=UPI003FCFF4E5
MKILEIGFLDLMIVMLSACDSNNGYEESYDSDTEIKLEDARNKIVDLQSQIVDLEASVSDLESTVDEFNYNDWADVVPSVISEVDLIRFHLDYVKSSTDDLEYSLE